MNSTGNIYFDFMTKIPGNFQSWKHFKLFCPIDEQSFQILRNLLNPTDFIFSSLLHKVFVKRDCKYNAKDTGLQ